MEVLAQQIRDIYSQTDDQGRKKIQNELEVLQSSLRTEMDTMWKLATGPVMLCVAKLGVDLGIFEALQQSSSGSLNVSEFSRLTHASAELLVRVLRAQAAFGLITQTNINEFTANKCTTALADPNIAGMVSYQSEHFGPVFQALPTFLRERDNQPVTSNKDTAFQKAFHTDLTAFEWMCQNPEQLKNLGKLMAIHRDRHWIETFPVEREVADVSISPHQAILVDVGGGYGQQAIAFRQRFPQLPGRVVVQDIPETLKHAAAVDGIEFMAHDFFKHQPIRAAKFYYLRHVLHDWPDEQAIAILRALIPALGPHSRIIVDEMVLPDTNVSEMGAFLDMAMLASLGGSERTRQEWVDLLDVAGLKVLEIVEYDPKQLCAIVAVPK
ncbi:S-adenosyl-L-methionine-dependent methyltransferase, partial [Aspergillus steynii IBT 23096]